uniref:Uncharacterized protein n=1 Tax=Tetranychus urticae TaxID=32264 RepID=T1KNH1_TETUR
MEGSLNLLLFLVLSSFTTGINCYTQCQLVDNFSLIVSDYLMGR